MVASRECRSRDGRSGDGRSRNGRSGDGCSRNGRSRNCRCTKLCPLILKKQQWLAYKGIASRITQ
jgi:hypothetical protein